MNENDSDNDEGFVPTRVEIKPDTGPGLLKADGSKERPTDFQARYIFGDGIFRKQPIEMYTRFSTYLSTNSQQKVSSPAVWPREELEHPYDKFVASSRYTLVYNRFKDKVSLSRDNDNFTNNEINLSKVLHSYDSDNFSIHKPFEFAPNPNSEADLEFDSRFECGNLHYAFRSTSHPNSYSLFLQNDTNSYGYNQWFCFSLKNAKPGINYRFTIMNLRKRHSFFGKGMKVAVFSLIDAQANNGEGWRKMGNNIKYERSCIRKRSDKKFKFYSLSFEMCFQHHNDFLCLAMNVPYSYSRLIHHLRICENRAQQGGRNWQIAPLAHSISNNALPAVTLTPSQDSKKMVIFLARQHPGQTWSSFLMEEILYSLSKPHTSQSLNWLLQNYTIKIFPMINVDGVIYGNFRCDVGGFDLNRNWKYPAKNLHPQVWAIRQEIEMLANEYEIECVMDLHGHSKQYNTFCYSCKDDPVRCRILPHLVSTLTDIFTIKDCTFGISRYKETTARAVIYSIIGTENVLTIQNSFYGYKDKQANFREYDPAVMGEIAGALLEGMCRFLRKDAAYEESLKTVKDNLNEFLSYERMMGGADSGSDSDPYGDEISLKEKIVKILPKSFTNICSELEADESLKKKSPKKKRILKKSPQVARNYNTIAPTRTRIVPSKEETEAQKQQSNKTFIQRTSLTHYKKNSNELSFPKRRSEQRSMMSDSGAGNSVKNIQSKDGETRQSLISTANQISLPFYVREKPRLVPIKLKNDSLEIFKDAYNATKDKDERKSDATFRKTSLKAHKKVRLEEGMIQKQLPLLCVFSETKKQSQLEKQRQNLQKTSTEFTRQPKHRTYVQNQKLQYLKKTTKEKDKSNSEGSSANATLISKIWRDNFTRYGKDLGIFFGGRK